MQPTARSVVPGAIKRKPLQAAKVVGIGLALVLGIAGFLRLVDARAFIDNPLLADGQFLSLLLIPILGVGLVCLVFLETLYAVYRSVRSEATLAEQWSGGRGYVVLRALEAGVAVLGVAIMASAVPVLFAESTPSPAGVGIMLLLLVVGLVILVASLLRSSAELLLYGSA